MAGRGTLAKPARRGQGRFVLTDGGRERNRRAPMSGTTSESTASRRSQPPPARGPGGPPRHAARPPPPDGAGGAPGARSRASAAASAAASRAALHRERPVDRHRPPRRSTTGRRTSSTTRSTSAARRRRTSSASSALAAVVHLGVMHDPRVSQAEHHTWNVAGFQRLLEYVAQYEVPKLVVLSSANVYGPRPDNPQFLAEDAPLLGGAAFSEIRDLIEVDMLAQWFFWKRPRDRDGDPAPGAHPRQRPQRAVELPPPQGDPDAPRLRPDGAGDPPGRRGRAPSSSRSAPACAASSTSPAPRRCPLSRLITLTGRPRVTIPHFLAHGHPPAPLALPRRRRSPRRSSTTSATSAWSTTAARARSPRLRARARHRGDGARGGRSRAEDRGRAYRTRISSHTDSAPPTTMCSTSWSAR